MNLPAWTSTGSTCGPSFRRGCGPQSHELPGDLLSGKQRSSGRPQREFGARLLLRWSGERGFEPPTPVVPNSVESTANSLVWYRLRILGANSVAPMHPIALLSPAIRLSEDQYADPIVARSP